MQRCVSLLLLAALGAAACSEPVPPTPDVVLVVLDTWRTDALTYRSGAPSRAPFLDRMAEEGAVFPNAFATSSWTAPSTASLLTGTYPDRHGVQQGFLAQMRHAGGYGNKVTVDELRLSRISDATRTLPQLMKDRGYRTYGIATNINIGQEMGFDRGFDRFRRESEWPAARVAKLLGDWRAEIVEGEGPFFLYLHLNDVHKPYDLRKKWFQPGQPGHPPELANYMSEVGYLDHHLEAMLTGLPLEEDTLLVVVSDHGEEFLDHGGMGHHFTLYNEVNGIVFLFRAPGLGVEAVRLEGVEAGGIDLAPTVLQLAGFAPPTEEQDGVGLAPFFKAGTAREVLEDTRQKLAGRALYAHRWGNDRNLYATVQEGWKLIEGPGEFGRKLFHVAEDPYERNDLAESHPERVEELAQRLEEYLAREYVPVTSSQSVDMDPELLEQLKMLGYVEGGVEAE